VTLTHAEGATAIELGVSGTARDEVKPAGEQVRGAPLLVGPAMLQESAPGQSCPCQTRFVAGAGGEWIGGRALIALMNRHPHGPSFAEKLSREADDAGLELESESAGI
jgi:hypothetical protein